jgi:hypothetical protein
MAMGDGWHLIGPLIAVALVGALGVMFWRMGVEWIERAEDPLREMYGLSIFAEPDDYGLLCAAAITDEPEEAEEIRLLLADAGIRATQAVRRDGRLAVLVFGEELEAARRLVR